MKLFSLILMSLICAATTAPLDNENQIPASTAAEVKIPPYMRMIHKMNQTMEQDDLKISLKVSQDCMDSSLAGASYT